MASPDLSHLDTRARNAVTRAHDEARSLRYQHVGTEHLLLGLIAEAGDTAGGLLASAGVLLVAARGKVFEASGPPPESNPGTEMTFTARAAIALDRGTRFAFNRRCAAVGTVHVLLGILDVEGTACQVLRGLGVDVDALRSAAEEAAENGPSGLVTAPEPTLSPRANTPMPTCPKCGAGLVQSLAHCWVPASGPDGDTTELGVAYCGACSATLGVWSR